MGASVGPQKTGKGRYRPMAEINVTPFVDVMLVLLIVFMVTAPLLTAGVPVDLPKAKAQNLPQDAKPLEIAIDQNGAIFIADTAIEFEQLVPRLEAIAGVRRDTRIYVRADQALDYGAVMRVVGAINASGFKKVALLTEAQ